jgi:hypothetical protein
MPGAGGYATGRNGCRLGCGVAMARASTVQRPPAGCTIVSRNYLSYARVLGESWLRHHEGSHFYALVVDGLSEEAETGPVEIVQPGALALPSFRELAFRFDVTELATAVKPAFLSFLLAREDAVVYLDPDVLVLGPFAEVERALSSAGIVLTPHTLAPIPRDGLRPSEEGILNTGVFNLGFLALHGSDDTSGLLSWWDQRVREACRIDYEGGVFFDQKWIDLVPAYFPSTAILRHLGYNVAYWNLHERPLERRDGSFSVGGKPLVFFHFSGFDPARPETLSKRVKPELARTEIAPGSALQELTLLYRDLHVEHGFEVSSRWEYGFGRLDNGVEVDSRLRQLYAGLEPEARRRFGDPFKTWGGSFFEWATRPREDGLSPFLELLYRRADLKAAFPAVPGSDLEAFLHWARTHGPGESGYAKELAQR